MNEKDETNNETQDEELERLRAENAALRNELAKSNEKAASQQDDIERLNILLFQFERCMSIIGNAAEVAPKLRRM